MSPSPRLIAYVILFDQLRAARADGHISMDVESAFASDLEDLWNQLTSSEQEFVETYTEASKTRFS